ncbi:MAG: cation-translocating P-type ATPase [Thermaurantiacus tibetensis]
MGEAPSARAADSAGDLPPHACPADAVLARLGATPAGLDPAEAEARLARHGPNRLPERRRDGPLRRLLRQFDNPLIWFLIAAAAISAGLDHGADSLVIAAVVLVNAAIGFLQEGRAEQALAAIRAMIDPMASVVRGGARTTVPAATLVPGDIVLLEPGDRVPADLRLLEASGLRLDEAVLTGESVPVTKTGAAVPADAPLGDRAGMAFAGTLVTAGQGRGVVVATGSATELGRISGMLADVGRTTTPLMEQMGRFARKLTFVILGLSVLAFAFAVVVRGLPSAEAFMLVVGIAVAAIPEGLPAVLTVTLAIGVRRMAARHALIRRLPAVETLGSVTVICSDKTGTLTRNEMAVTVLALPSSTRAVSGVGYAPDGEIDGGVNPGVADLVRVGLLCNDARVTERDGQWVVDGDPMEGALVTLAMKAGLAGERATARREAVLPFAPETRLMATLDVRADGRRLAAIKGAPEAVLPLCGLDADAEAQWQARAAALAAEGLRVLAFAEAEAADVASPASLAGARLLGLAGLIDPPRPEAIEAVAACRRAGIRVVMITGDHAGTAQAIARALALADEPGVLTGAELDRLDDAALAARLDGTAVFARTAPEHKLRLVEAFQRQGHVVAMTGDGVNDAPALKRADIGIAMGRKGTEAAKEAADMVLADDNFASIAAAVREGRTVWDNLMKVIGWTLPTNGGEAMTILAALALGLVLPLTPLQVLWINMVTATTLGLALAFEPGEEGAMLRPPRDRAQPILSGRLLWRVAFVSLLVTAGAFGMFAWAKASGWDLAHARTLVVNVIVAMEVFYLFAVRYAHSAGLSLRGLAGTPAVLIAVVLVSAAQLLFTYWPPMQRVFSTTPLTALELLMVVAVGVCLLLVVEAEKAIARRLAARAQVPQKVASTRS